MAVTTEKSADGTAIRPLRVEIPEAEIKVETAIQQIEAVPVLAAAGYSHRVLEGIGHNVPQEAPEAFAAAILEVGGAK